LGDQSVVEPIVRVALYDNNKSVREFAVKALGALTDIRALKPLVRALRDENPYVWETAVEAVASLGDGRAIKALIEIALHGREERIRREEAIWALGKLSDGRALRPLAWLALHEKDTLIRICSVGVLGELGDNRAVAPLVKALHDKDSVVRMEAAHALGELGVAGNKHATRTFVKFVHDEGYKDSWLFGARVLFEIEHCARRRGEG
jgi:HEAT repeat protein